MNTVGERIKEVRKTLGLSGSVFGEKLGLSKGALSNIERNVNGASDRTIRLICSEYCVDYFWLTEGKGEMFIDDTEALIEALAAERKCTPEETDMLKKLFSLPEDQFNIVLGMIKNMKDE